MSNNKKRCDMKYLWTKNLKQNESFLFASQTRQGHSGLWWISKELIYLKRIPKLQRLNHRKDPNTVAKSNKKYLKTSPDLVPTALVKISFLLKIVINYMESNMRLNKPQI